MEISDPPLLVLLEGGIYMLICVLFFWCLLQFTRLYRMSKALFAYSSTFLSSLASDVIIHPRPVNQWMTFNSVTPVVMWVRVWYKLKE